MSCELLHYIGSTLTKIKYFFFRRNYGADHDVLGSGSSNRFATSSVSDSLGLLRLHLVHIYFLDSRSGNRFITPKNAHLFLCMFVVIFPLRNHIFLLRYETNSPTCALYMKAKP